MRSLIIFLSLAPAWAWSGAGTRTLVTSVVFFGLPYECFAPEPTDCLSAEIARRTVRIESHGGWCSGVLITPRLIRTAGHCFLGMKLKRVWTGDRVELKANFRYSYQYTQSLDQAEIRADRDLVDVDPLPIVKVRPTDQLRGVVVVGYPGNGPLVRHAAVVVSAPSGRAGGDGEFVYKLAAQDRWRARPGASGGPTFSPLACQLRLIGTNDSYNQAFTNVQAFRPIPTIARTNRSNPRVYSGVTATAD